MFDTLKINNLLLKSGFTEQQSVAVTESLKESIGQENLATKEDLKETKHELKEEIQEVRSEIKLLKWMIGFSISLSFIVLGGIVALFFK